MYRVAYNAPPSEYEYAESLYEDPDAYAYDIYAELVEPYMQPQNDETETEILNQSRPEAVQKISQAQVFVKRTANKD